MKTLGILFAALLLATEGLPQPIVEARPTVYSHLLDPSLYPDYTRRPSRAPTWATLTDKLNLVFARLPVLSAARVTAPPDERQLKLGMKMPRTGETRFNELPPGERFPLGQRNEFKAWRIHNLPYWSSFTPQKQADWQKSGKDLSKAR